MPPVSDVFNMRKILRFSEVCGHVRRSSALVPGSVCRLQLGVRRRELVDVLFNDVATFFLPLQHDARCESDAIFLWNWGRKLLLHYTGKPQNQEDKIIYPQFDVPRHELPCPGTYSSQTDESTFFFVKLTVQDQLNCLLILSVA